MAASQAAASASAAITAHAEQAALDGYQVEMELKRVVRHPPR
ncbi:hypothetical protein [Streptomyces sp. NPDC048521]